MGEERVNRGGLAEGLASAVVIAVCALAVVYPLLVHGPSCGHDFDFHLQSWLAVLADWQRGIAVPRWLPGANCGAGEPRFLFYPPLSWLLGALLGLVLPWTSVPAAFTWCALAAGGLSAYVLARSWLSRTAAVAAGCLYLANPYLLFTGYERTAYGELLAAAWLPLLVLSLLRPVPNWQARLVPVALILAALWLTNAPAAVMGCYCALFSAVLQAVPRFRVAGLPAWRNLGAVLGGIAGGTLLAGDYVLPAWYEQRWVQIARANAPGMRVEDSFLFGHTGEAFHDQVLRMASWLAVAVLSAAAVATLVSRVGPRKPSAIEKHLALLSVAVLILLLPLSAPVWHLLPELAFLQFPWRWLLLAGLAAATLVASCWHPQWSRRATFLGLLLWSLGSSLWAQHQLRQPCDEEDAVDAQLRLGDAGFEGTDEYTPGAADNGEVQQGLPPVRLLRTPDANEGDDSVATNPPWKPDLRSIVPGQFRVGRWTPEDKQVVVLATAPAYAVLRLERYPAWQVRVNGAPCGTGCTVPREDGLLTVRVPAGRTSIAVHLATTPDIWEGRAMSLGAALVLLGLAARRKRTAPLAGYDEGDAS